MSPYFDGIVAIFVDLPILASHRLLRLELRNWLLNQTGNKQCQDILKPLNHAVFANNRNNSPHPPSSHDHTSAVFSCTATSIMQQSI
ncbi:uncharacterized protein LOC118767534 isoform X2 [Octopus sinensis]|nr:uncharacterized protein LOC118767534 isoform X2 [Octopus sinensis]